MQLLGIYFSSSTTAIIFAFYTKKILTSGFGLNE